MVNGPCFWAYDRGATYGSGHLEMTLNVFQGPEIDVHVLSSNTLVDKHRCLKIQAKLCFYVSYKQGILDKGSTLYSSLRHRPLSM